MNSGPFVSDWLRLLAVLGIELGAIAAVFALLQRVFVSPKGRRLSWRSALIGSLLIVGFELAGVSRWMAGWWPADAADPQRVTIVSSNLDPTPELGSLPTASLNAPGGVALHPPAFPSDNVPPMPTWWPGWLWLGGVVLLTGRMVVARLVFAGGLRRHRRFCDPQVARRVLELANLLGLSRRIRVFQLEKLPAPISYGAFRAGIVLPAQFGQDNDDSSRDAMLLHELAHVSARDGFWHGAGDLVVACLWWHPAVWWMRREMESASELAADEASVAVENGPRVLAECLVRMARRLTAPAGSGWQGIQGSRFRSRMGRRVERLLGLGPALPPVNRPARRWLERAAMTLLLSGMVVLGGLLSHRQATDGLSWRTSWHASFGGMFLSQLAAAEPEASEVTAPQDRIGWIPWNDAAVAEARAQGRPVLVVFTADWAINTVVNEKVALEVPAVRERLRAMGAATLKADWTFTTNEVIAAALRAFGKESVPLTLVYSADPTSTPEVLPEVLTPEIVLAALERAASAVEPAPKAQSVQSNSSPGEVLIQQVSTRLFEAKALLDAGLLSEAKSKFADILRDDPKSEAALHYLTMIDRKRTRAEANPSSRASLNSQLDSIHLASFGGTKPLSATVEQLNREVRATDPFGRGLNFIIDSTPLRFGDLSSIMVQLDPPLRDASVRQVLDAIVKIADRPIKYSIEDYAIVFSLHATEPVPLHTRWFKIDPNTFLRGIGFDFGAGARRSDGGGGIQTAPGRVGIDHVTVVNSSDQIIMAARQFFTSAGVDFATPGKQLFFHGRLEMLMVRATLGELDIIEKAIQVINTAAPQVVIEATFCDVSAEALAAVGFDWLFGHRESSPSSVGVTAGSRSVAVDFGLPMEPEKAELQGPPAWISPGILTEPQAGAVIRALGERRGVTILSMPRVTTLSGRQAQIKVVDVRRVVTHLEPGQKYAGMTLAPGQSGAASTNLLSAVEEFESGPVLDVVPYVQADGRTIELTLIASVKEFVGYDLDGARLLGAENPGTPVTAGAVFRQRQIMTRARVWDGQTVVLAGGEDKLDIVRSKKQLLGSIPPLGRFFRAQHLEQQKTKLLVVLVKVSVLR